MGREGETTSSHSTSQLRQRPPKRFLSSVAWLRHEYLSRKTKNHSYSLRAFARQLHLTSGSLSELLSEKRPVTLKLALRLADRLNLSAEDRTRFLEIVHRERSSDLLSKKMGAKEKVPNDYRQLSEDRFNVIAEWYHFAIMALFETEQSQGDPQWIAKRLGISVVEVRLALDRCLRLGLIEPKGSTYIPAGNLTTTHDIPSSALRRFHKQNLARAAETIETRAVEERDISAITMAIDPTRLVLAKKIILRFRRQMAKLLENGSKTEVYNLSILLMPLTQPEKSRG